MESLGEQVLGHYRRVQTRTSNSSLNLLRFTINRIHFDDKGTIDPLIFIPPLEGDDWAFLKEVLF